MVWGGSRIAEFKREQIEGDHIGESWELSPMPGHESVVTTGEYAGKTLNTLVEQFGKDLVGSRVVDKFGDKFPLLIKFIDSNRDLSIQVHPDDELASRKHGSLGKTEMWYAVDADADAYLYDGFNCPVDRNSFLAAIESKTIVGCLSKYNVTPGDVYYIPAGRVHALGTGNLVLEIQEASDITYRVYDYDRRDLQGNLRQLHVDDAAEAADFGEVSADVSNVQAEDGKVKTLVDCSYFNVSLLGVDGEHQLKLAKGESFTIIISVGGDVEIEDADHNVISLPQGHTALIPAEMSEVKLHGCGKVIIVNI